MKQGGDEVEPALHAAGEVFYRIAAAVGELHGLEGGVDAGAEIGAAEAVEFAEDAEVLVGREVGVECDVLRDEPEGDAGEGEAAAAVMTGMAAVVEGFWSARAFS